MTTLPDRYYQEVADALVESRINGKHLAEVLADRGLLRTESSIREVRAETLWMLDLHMRTETATSLIRWAFKDSVPHSNAEFWVAVRAWIDQFMEIERERAITS